MSGMARNGALARCRVGLGVGEGLLRNPTNRRQGKRPALWAAYVVGWIGEFDHLAHEGCWRFLQIVQAFQRSERRRSESLQGAGP